MTPFDKKKKNSNWSKKIKLYVVPIFTITVFVFIILGLTLPRVLSIIDLNAQISTLNSDLQSKRDEVTKLQLLSNNVDEISNFLSIVRDIAPVGVTEVVSFRDKITTIISSNRLTISTQRLSETDIQSEGTESDFFLREIPFVFDVSGSLSSIVSFINELNSIDEFIVVKEMQLSQSADGQGVWTLSINIVKYQFTEELNDANVQQLFQNISVDSKISEEIKEFLERRL